METAENFTENLIIIGKVCPLKKSQQKADKKLPGSMIDLKK